MTRRCLWAVLLLGMGGCADAVAQKVVEREKPPVLPPSLVDLRSRELPSGAQETVQIFKHPMRGVTCYIVITDMVTHLDSEAGAGNPARTSSSISCLPDVAPVAVEKNR